MNLSKKPEFVTWPATQYVFIEKVGPFMETAPKAWQATQQVAGELSQQCKILGAMSLYRIKPQMIYRAGYIVDSRLKQLPDGLQFFAFPGGKYAKFTYKGSYAHMPEACGQVMSMVETSKIPLRDDFYIENYVNDPKSTPPEELITEILVPTS